MSVLRSKKKYFIALLFPLIALWGMPSLYATAKEPITPHNTKDQLLVHGYLKKETDKYLPTGIIKLIQEYYTLTPHRKIKLLAHQKLPENQGIYFLKNHYCLIVKNTLHFYPYDDAQGTSTKQCRSPFEGTIVTMQDIGDKLIIATDEPGMVLFDPATARIVHKFELFSILGDKNEIPFSCHTPTAIYSIGKGRFITTETEARRCVHWHIRREYHIQDVLIANAIRIWHVAPMPTSEHIVICYQEEVFLNPDLKDEIKNLTKCCIYDLKTTSFLNEYSFDETLSMCPLSLRIEMQGPCLFIQMRNRFFYMKFVKVQRRKNNYAFFEKECTLPQKVWADLDLGDLDLIEVILIPFPSNLYQVLALKEKCIKLYTITSPETYQLIHTLDVSSFAIGDNASCITKFNNTVVIHDKRTITIFKLS